MTTITKLGLNWPRNQYYPWVCRTRLTKKQDLHHIFYPMNMWNKIDQETWFISFILSNEHVEQDWPRNKICIIYIIQWACGTRLTKKRDLFDLILSNEHVEQDWPRNKIYIIYIFLWACGTRLTKKHDLFDLILSNEHVEQDWPRNKIYIISIIQWACGTRLTKKRDFYHIYYPMSIWNKNDQGTKFTYDQNSPRNSDQGTRLT